MGTGSSRQRSRPHFQPPPPAGGWDGGSNSAAGIAGAGGVSYPPPPVVYRPPVPPYYNPDPQQQGSAPFVHAWRPPHPGAFPQPHQAPYGPPPQQVQGRPPPRASAYPSPPQQEMAQTCTIRNLVNVKKHTLRLEPVSGSTTRFALRFTMDASAPCVVTVFFQGVEDQANGQAITAAGGPAHPPMHFEKKLLQEYPRPGAQGAILDTALFREEQLDGRLVGPQHAGPYPIIIRMEAVLDAAGGAARDLRSVAAGAPQQTWVQSQTTYAALARHDDHREPGAGAGAGAGAANGAALGQPVVVHHDARAPALRVLRQKIWVEGVSFELQEIYGMEHHTGGSPAPLTGASGKADGKSAQEEAEERLCVICLVNERNTTVLPCRHMCMCNECAQELRKQTSKCPICRNSVDSLLHIRRESKPVAPATPLAAATPVP